MIVNMTRSAIILEVDGKRITLKGEAFLPGYGSPNFLIAKNSFLKWDDPAIGEVTPIEREEIIAVLSADFKSKGLIYEIED